MNNLHPNLNRVLSQKRQIPTFNLAGEEQRSWRSVLTLHLGPNHLNLSKVLLSFYQIFYSWFQISCVVRNNYVNDIDGKSIYESR